MAFRWGQRWGAILLCLFNMSTMKGLEWFSFKMHNNPTLCCYRESLSNHKNIQFGHYFCVGEAVPISRSIGNTYIDESFFPPKTTNLRNSSNVTSPSLNVLSFLYMLMICLVYFFWTASLLFTCSANLSLQAERSMQKSNTGRKIMDTGNSKILPPFGQRLLKGNFWFHFTNFVS